jgi:Heliorhodopsin
MDARERRELIAHSPISFAYLKRFNLFAGVLHAVQGAAMLLLGVSLAWSRDVYTFYLKITPNPSPLPGFTVAPDPRVLFHATNLGAFLASFLLVSAIAHFAIVFWKNRQYNQNLSRGWNPYRWYEYSVSSSIMIVLIALFLGVWDFWSLAMIFTLNAMMIWFGYLMEKLNQNSERTDWSPFVLGSVSGAVPWVVLFANFTALATSSSLRPPTFVYVIVGLYFVLFNVFAVNMVLQYRGVGRWKDYLYGERVYILLSLVAKSLLAWIVFAGVFAP